ncbi:hypothetical protein DFH09DRAFT_1483914 [Mycena vulgaris]|nr:hypothetical protein DFH09DRAFT_1483914 [Mycena vulgaris]
MTIGGQPLKFVVDTSLADWPAAIHADILDDTRIRLIGGPTLDVATIWAAVPGAIRSPTRLGFSNSVRSSSVTGPIAMLKISFALGGVTAWPINPVDLNLGPISTGSSQCFGAIYEINTILYENFPNWVFGAAFLASPGLFSSGQGLSFKQKNVYTVFRTDPLMIGFAQLSSIATGSAQPSLQPSVDPGPDNSAPARPVEVRTIVGGILGCLVLAVSVGLLCRQRCGKSSHSKISDSKTTPEMPGIAIERQPPATDSILAHRIESPTGALAHLPSPCPNSDATATGEILNPQTASNPSQTSDGIPPSSHQPHDNTPSPTTNLGVESDIQEVPRTSDDDSSTTFRRRGGSFIPEPPLREPMTLTPWLENSLNPSSLPRSLSMMKREQTAAAHHYGELYTASDVLVHTPDGLQLSSVLEDRPWRCPMRASISGGNEVSEVQRASPGDTNASSPSDTREVETDPEDLPPVYSP